MNRRRTWIGAVVLAVVIGGAVTVGAVVSYTDGARPGAAFPGIGEIDSAHDAEVKLPIGTLTVQVGRPSQEYDTDYDETTRAADGAVVVPVAWDLAGAQAGIPNSVPVYQFQLTLVADDRRYDLQAGHEDDPAPTAPVVVPSGTTAAVVEGDGSDLEVEVEYDGLTQVLDVDSGKIDAGLAAPYYATGGPRSLRTSTGCSALSADDARTVTFGLDDCNVGPVQLTPYIGGFGWVDSKDESWATVPYSVQVAGVQDRRGYTTYAVKLRALDVTLDGRKPTADILRDRDPSSAFAVGVKVFRTSTAPTTLGLTTEVQGDARYYGKGTRVFRNEQSFPLR